MTYYDDSSAGLLCPQKRKMHSNKPLTFDKIASLLAELSDVYRSDVSYDRDEEFIPPQGAHVILDSEEEDCKTCKK